VQTPTLGVSKPDLQCYLLFSVALLVREVLVRKTDHVMLLISQMRCTRALIWML